MNWGSATEFFAMGGYGLYVWSSYAAMAVLMLTEPWLTAQRHRQALRLAAQQSRSESIE